MGQQHLTQLFFFVLFISLIFSQTYCPNAPAVREDRRTDKTRLVISTFNVEWLFLYRSNCPGAGCTWKDVSQAMNHMNHIADKIATINADIFVLEEVENCVVLRDLLALPQLANKGYKPYMVQGTDTATGQNVGIITKIDPTNTLARTTARASWPIPGNTCNSKKTTEATSGVSKHLYTRFDIPGLSKPLLLVGLHFLAFPTTPDRCVEREAQATVIRGIIDQHAGYDVVVLGDFNDYDATFKDESGESVPTSRVLSIIKGNDLTNAALLHPNANNGNGVYSSWWDINSNCKDDGKAEHTVIDHILLSKTLTARSFKYGHIFTAGCSSNVSDHWPVVVEIPIARTTLEEPQDEQPVSIQGVPQQEIVGEHSSGSLQLILIIGVVCGTIAFLVIILAIFVRKFRHENCTAEEKESISSV